MYIVPFFAHEKFIRNFFGSTADIFLIFKAPHPRQGGINPPHAVSILHLLRFPLDKTAAVRYNRMVKIKKEGILPC